MATKKAGGSSRMDVTALEDVSELKDMVVS